MVLCWKKVDATEFVTRWGSQYLTLQWDVVKHQWRLTVEEAGKKKFAKQTWKSTNEAMQAIDKICNKLVTQASKQNAALQAIANMPVGARTPPTVARSQPHG